MANKRKSLCIDEKVSLIRAIEAGEKICDVGTRFGFSRSTVATIWKNKEKYLQAEKDGKTSKKLKKPKYQGLDQAMLSWYHRQRQNNMPITGPIVKAKAEELSEELGLTAFKASEGWLGRFRQRHNINYGKINGEEQSVDTNVTYNWINRVWSTLREKYAPSDIFNAEEVRFVFKLNHDKSLKLKEEECVERKLSNERITVLEAANMSGTEVHKLVVVGKSENPWSNENIEELPVNYEANNTAWMTCELFEEELRRWDAELEGRKILLLVNDCPTHPLISDLQNIELAFCPPNTTSVLQPINQSVIKNLTGHYTQKLLMELVESEVGGYKLGELLIEGKTKQVFDLPEVPGHCLLLNKDRITAGDGVKAHDLEGKAAISNQTNAKVFDILTSAGVKTAFVKIASPTAFVSKKCDMIPIEWVTRRLATGSFLKRNPGVPEGFRFTPPKQETFYKDDANHDPQWSEEQIVSANFKINGLTIGQDEVDYMRKATILVFEILEKAWALRDCALIDMKIEFGIDADGNILLADVIDSDSWRLWPSGDKRLMVDKQVYRNLTTVTAADLDVVKRNFAWVKDQLDHLKPNVHHKVVVLMGSPADQEHCQKIAKAARELGLDVELRVTSAHKATEETLHIMQQYEDTHGALVFIAVAGRSNGLGPVLSGNTSYPVINCPPPSDKLVQDIWSSLSVPSGLGCATVIYPDSAALMAAQIIGLQDYLIWARLRVKQLEMATSLRQADKKLRNLNV